MVALSRVQSNRHFNAAWLVQLAMVYSGLEPHALAKQLHRSTNRIVPASGNPTADYLVRLAGVLDWPTQDVVRAITGAQPRNTRPAKAQPFYLWQQRAARAHRKGLWHEMISCGEAMREAATTPLEAALGWNRIAGGRNGLGQFESELEALQCAIREPVPHGDVARMITANLANAHFTLDHPVESRTLATSLIEQIDATRSRRSRLDTQTLAFALATRGLIARLSLDVPPAKRRAIAREAIADLVRCQLILAEQSKRAQRSEHKAIANTCRGVLLELRCVTGDCTATCALETIRTALQEIAQPEDGQLLVQGDELESWGWWAISGCAIARRHLRKAGVLRELPEFIGAGFAIGNRLENWNLMAESLSHIMEIKRLGGTNAGRALLSADRQRATIEIMARLPGFRANGWALREITKKRKRKKP